MNTEQLIANYSPVGDMITIILCWSLLFLIAKVLYFTKDRKFVFLKRSLHFILVGAGSNITFYLLIVNHLATSTTLFVLRDIYHLNFMCCLYCYILYMKKMLDVKGTVASIVAILTRFLFCICLVLEILSPFTKIGIFLSDGNIWHDSIVSPFNFYYAYTLVILASMLLFYSKRIIRPLRVCLIATEIVVTLIMLYQAKLNINTFSSFTYVLPVLVVLVLLHSRPFDDKTGALGSSSFDSFVRQTYKKGLTVDYMVLKLYISVTDQIPDELGKVLNSFWHSAFKDASLFSLSTDLYILAIPKGNRNGNTKEKMTQLIQNHFPAYYEQYKLPFKMVKLYDIDFAENVEDILGILKYILQIMEENSTFVVDQPVIEQLQKYKKIRYGLADIEAKNDLNDPRVLVYCQPIRNMQTGRFDTAEALMRLSLPDVGFVMPGMFIELAEQYNHIHTLTKIMLNKVCKQIKVLENEGYDFERISINFAASEIKAEGFCVEILDIIKANGVDPSKIGIELTESQTESDFVIANKKMKMLRNAGMTLYLDDVGTGYSNIDRIVQYDVDVVKFDRFFLLEAEKSMKVVKMLQHLSQAFRDMDYKLLYEGVETQEHEELCLNCGADYIQGFKYSKPIPAEELVNFFSKTGEKTDTKYIRHHMVDSEADEKIDFTLKEMKDQYSILLTMSKLFYSMHVIDLINNTATPYNPTEDKKVIDVVDSTLGADLMMKQIMRMCTEYAYVDSVLEFTDLSTIPDRMKGKRILSGQFVGKSIGGFIASFYTIEADEEGRPTKVVYTTRSIEEYKNNINAGLI